MEVDTEASSSMVKEFKLESDQELRFEVVNNEVVVELLDGTAETFGAELVQHKRYAFSVGSRVALYSWHGCRFELAGKPDGAYVAKQTPMVIYLNTHAALEEMRCQAERDLTRGPRIMLVGPTDVGKSSYCKILVNYAARLGRSLTFVDLDVGQNSVSIPGAIAAVYIEKPGDPIDGLDNKVPLVYYYGHKSPGQNIQLYNTVVDRLAYMVNEKCKRNKTANVGGVVINTCGWIKGEGYECIRNAAEAFEVDVVVVLDHERLYSELQKDLPSCVKTVHQPKSGGVEERTQEMRVKIRRRKIRQYFYGTIKTPLTPHSFPLRFDEVEIYKIGVPRVPDSCMPLGMKSEDSSLKIVQISPQTEMIVQRILAVSHCENLQDEDLVRTNVAGFLCVTEVNLEQKTFTVLSPQPYPLPQRILLLSDVDFVDH